MISRKITKMFIGAILSVVIGTSLFGQLNVNAELNKNLDYAVDNDYEIKENGNCLCGAATPVAVSKIDFNRLAKNKIEIVWNDETDPFVSSYSIYRRNTLNSVGTGNWKLLSTVKSDGVVNNSLNHYVDVLSSSNPQQYEYVITVTVNDNSKYIAAFGKAIIASNIKVCIDPGHYTGKNVVEAAPTYCEGDFTLRIGAALYQELRKYGISAVFTRTTPNINIGGYVNDILDGSHISLRGEMAGMLDCDLFVSLHTNANGENAHGNPTYFQPISLNHPIVIVNVPATKNQVVLNMANSIGGNLVNENLRFKISSVTNYVGAKVGAVPGWNNEINDELNISGLTLCRLGSSGKDYYGVLRGAANVNVPGMIIEHGFHTVPEMRKAAKTTGLETAWAKADAYGIAYGLGFLVNPIY